MINPVVKAPDSVVSCHLSFLYSLSFPLLSGLVDMFNTSSWVQVRPVRDRSGTYRQAFLAVAGCERLELFEKGLVVDVMGAVA